MRHSSLKIFLSIIGIMISVGVICFSSYCISEFSPINQLIGSNKFWYEYGFIISLVISISLFIFFSILLGEILYIYSNNKLKKGVANG